MNGQVPNQADGTTTHDPDTSQFATRTWPRGGQTRTRGRGRPWGKRASICHRLCIAAGVTQAETYSGYLFPTCSRINNPFGTRKPDKVRAKLICDHVEKSVDWAVSYRGTARGHSILMRAQDILGTCLTPQHLHSRVCCAIARVFRPLFSRELLYYPRGNSRHRQSGIIHQHTTR
jgi:hypothetical protein